MPTPSSKLPATSLQEARQAAWAVRDDLIKCLIDRRVEVTLGMTALIARQHLFMLGPPGTAKTMVARYFGQAIKAPYFELLLTKFTEPSEVFGPISIKGLVEREEYTRNTAGYLPTVQIATLDEIWKANSAILNSLLTIINERVFDNGGRRTPVPLDTLFAASNELPEDASLEALYDRFLLRTEVATVADPARLLETLPTPTKHLTGAQLRLLQTAAARVDTTFVHGMMGAILTNLRASGIAVGDRRFRQSATLIQASAALLGRTVAEPSDLPILAYCYWQTPEQIGQITQVIEQVVRTGVGPAPSPRTPPPPRTPPRTPPRASTPQAPTPPSGPTALSEWASTPTYGEVRAMVLGSSQADLMVNRKLHQGLAFLSYPAGTQASISATESTARTGFIPGGAQPLDENARKHVNEWSTSVKQLPGVTWLAP
jgi:MoxR-like ATPase